MRCAPHYGADDPRMLPACRLSGNRLNESCIKKAKCALFANNQHDWRMGRGCRDGLVTKAALRECLSPLVDSTGAAVLPPASASVTVLLGHAIHYKVVTPKQVSETVPRNESTIPCYLRPRLQHMPPGFGDSLERYVKIASRLYHRGAVIANWLAMDLCGARVPVPVSGGAARFIPDAAAVAVAELSDLLFVADIRNGAFKQAFLPERWPSKAVHRYPGIVHILATRSATLPPLPDWKGIMVPTGWDNAINRMATKYHGNIQVHVCNRLPERVADYLRVARLDAGTPRDVFIEMTVKRPRPLAICNNDFTMAMDLRRAMGVEDSDAQWYPPLKPEWSAEVFALHMFLTRHGSKERAYLPVVHRGRKYCYVDAKIAGAMLSDIKRRSKAAKKKVPRKEDHLAAAAKKKRPREKNAAPGGAKRTRPRQEKAGATTADDTDAYDAPPDPPDGDDETSTSLCIGDLLGLTPPEFNRRNMQIREAVRRRLRTLTKRPKTTRKHRDRLKRRAARLGAGIMPKDARVDSIETDGVGLRLCIKVPINMRPYIKRLPTAEEVREAPGAAATKKKRKRTHERVEREPAPRAIRPPDVPGEPGTVELPPIFLGADEGRKKPFVAAISLHGWQKPRTVVFTRSSYYADMGYWRHQTWSKQRASRQEIASALLALSEAGGLKNCDPARWEATMAAERTHEALLDAEYVESPDYALWRMRLFRKKRRSLDNASNNLMLGAVKGQPIERHLVVGIGDVKMASTGRGEMAAPTTALAQAFKRAIARVRATGRVVIVGSIWEYRTTMCCCGCGEVTRPARVAWRDKAGVQLATEEGEPQTRGSRRLRLCTSCKTEGKQRDRDVQAARNMLWLTQHEYFGAPRPWYMCRESRERMLR